MTSVTKRSPAAQVAAERKEDGRADLVLASGVRARIRPVAAVLIEEVTSRIEDPEMPTWHNPDKDRDEPNPGDPEYLRAMAAASRQRGVAAIDAMVMFGVELVDPLPPVGEWLPKLKMLEARGLLDLSGYKTSDPVDLEFMFKRYIAVSSSDLGRISRASGVQPEEVSRAAATFPGDAAGNAGVGREAGGKDS